MVMNELRINDQNIDRIKQKTVQLLKLGVKIKGNYQRQNNIIRTWSRYKNNIFSIVATSGREFGHNSDMLEIKSFGLSKDYYLAILIINNQIFETRLESQAQATDQDTNAFINSFLASEADLKLIKEKIEAEGHNLKDIIFL